MNIKIAAVILIFSFLMHPLFLFAQQDVSDMERMRELLEKEKALREKIEKKEEKPEIEEKIPVKEIPPAPEEKVFIKKIIVTGNTLISQQEIERIISPFENQELTLKDFRKIADLITDAYRQKGYVTSRAYLPPQKIEEGILEIRIIEGITGDLEVKGNRYFKTSLLKRKIILTKGEPFNYNILRKGLTKINRHPDRNARAVLVPGKDVGTTDIILEIEERLPVHISFDFDNFGSRFIEKDRYATTITHNNLLGWDDILSIQYQLAQAETYDLGNLRYIFPVTDDLEVGFYVARSYVDLCGEYKDLESRGKTQIYSIFVTKPLIDKENLSLNLNLGFDYKDTFNFLLGDESSRDRMRVVKLGLDLDFSDKFGRNIISNELDFGIPNFMAGSKEKEYSTDARHTSRDGSGGRFIKNNLSILRLQQMPFGSTLFWKNQFQFSPYILTATEQFQIGGITSVRGYPPAEHSGDRGYATSVEFSIPPYFISRNIKVPLSKAKLYDALRFVLFYDWGNVRLKNPQPGSEKSETLKAAGFGFRFNLPEDFSLRLDFGYPIGGRTPSDSDHLHTWIEVSKGF